MLPHREWKPVSQIDLGRGTPVDVPLLVNDFSVTDQELRDGVMLPNGADGVILLDGATLNTIGGMTADHPNVISANGLNDVNLFHSDFNNVLGNYVGTNISGTAVLTGQLAGITIQGGSGNVIGCTVMPWRGQRQRGRRQCVRHTRDWRRRS